MEICFGIQTKIDFDLFLNPYKKKIGFYHKDNKCESRNEIYGEQRTNFERNFLT